MTRVPVRDDLRALEGYHSPQVDVRVRLNTNEAPGEPPAAWRDAFAAAGRDLEVEATRERDPLDPLPWDHVRSGVSKEFLLDEWWQSRAERPTGDCRWDGCSDCGACVGPVRNRLVEA